MAIVKKNYKRRPSLGVRKTSFKKAVSKIARNVVMRTAETKTGVIAPLPGGTFGTNGSFQGIWSTVTQGTAQAQRIGEEIRTLGIKIRGRVQIDPAVITASRELTGFRMMIVTGKRPLTITDMPSFAAGVDPETLTVLMDRYYKFDSTKFCVFINKYIKFRRVVSYSGAGTPTKNELYIYLTPCPVPAGAGGVLAASGYIHALDVQQYWKDV